MKKKILIITIVSLILLSVVITLLIIKKSEVQNNESETNVIEKVKKYNKLEFKNLKITEEENQTSFTFDIINTSEEKYEGGYARIECKDKDNIEIGNIVVYIPEVEPKQQISVNASTDIDLTNAYDYVVVSSDV